MTSLHAKQAHHSPKMGILFGKQWPYYLPGNHMGEEYMEKGEMVADYLDKK